MLDVVALIEDLPEFSDEEGQMYAMQALRADHLLMVLHCHLLAAA